MNEEIKPENMRIHSRADELIACLEGEIAKRDGELAACRIAVENCELFRARIAELESQYQRDVYGLNNEGDPIGGEPAGGYANDNARLRAELASIKAQDTVGEVVGWYRLDRPYEMTSYPSVCATWHRLGAPVAPLYAAHAQQVSVPDGWRELAKRADDFLYSLPETDSVLRLRADLCSMLAAPAAPAADAGKLADAFLSWKLPESVRPDGCAMDPTYPHRYGTNLMTWAQAKEMFEYVLVAHRAQGVQ